METLGIEDIAALLKIDVRSTYNRMYRHPDSVPPKLNIPHQSKPLWLKADVEDWLQEMRRAA